MGADRTPGGTQYQRASAAVETMVSACGKKAGQKDSLGGISAEAVDGGISNAQDRNCLRCGTTDAQASGVNKFLEAWAAQKEIEADRGSGGRLC